MNLLSNGLKQRGIEIEVLVSNTRAKAERENINGISVTKVPQIGRFASAPLNMTFSFWLRRLGKDADILHFHFPNPTAEISYLFSGLEKEVVVTYHSDIVRQEKMGKLYSPLLLRFIEKASTIIVSSPNYMHSSIVLSKFLYKCETIPFGINLHRFTSVSENTKEVETLRRIYGSSVILFVGRFRYYKGLHVLIEAMNKVNGKLLIIGSGPLEEDLSRQIISEKLEEKVIILGELSDEEVVHHLHACEVFVLPSILRSEAFGIVQLEAMACKKPVVSTELGTGTSFVNQHQKTGLVVPPNDREGLAQAINYLLANPEQGKKLGAAGCEQVEKYFTQEQMVDKTIEIYRKSLTHRPVAATFSYKVSKKVSEGRLSEGKTKVLRIISRLNIGGPSIHVHLLTKGLNSDRFESILVSGKISPHEGDMTYLFDSHNKKPIVIPQLQREINLGMDLRAVIRILKILIKERPDIVHTHTAKAGSGARLAVIIYNIVFNKKIRAIHTFHGHIFKGYFSRAKSWFFVFIERIIAKLTDVIIAISETQKKELAQEFHIAPPGKIKTIRLGFDLEPFFTCKSLKGKFRKSLGIDHDTFTIGIIGRLAPIKNHRMFFDAANIFVAQNPDIQVKFVVVGDGELRNELEDYCQKLGLSKNVIFCGWIKNIPMVYTDLDILALTSLNEGTPVSIIESMAASVPVISTDAGGVRDLLGEPDNSIHMDGFKVCERGILSPKNDPFSFEKGIKYLLEDEDGKREGRLKRARLFVKKMYSQERLLTDIELLYTELQTSSNS